MLVRKQGFATLFFLLIVPFYSDTYWRAIYIGLGSSIIISLYIPTFGLSCSFFFNIIFIQEKTETILQREKNNVKKSHMILPVQLLS